MFKPIITLLNKLIYLIKNNQKTDLSLTTNISTLSFSELFHSFLMLEEKFDIDIASKIFQKHVSKIEFRIESGEKITQSEQHAFNSLKKRLLTNQTFHNKYIK